MYIFRISSGESALVVNSEVVDFARPVRLGRHPAAEHKVTDFRYRFHSAVSFGDFGAVVIQFQRILVGVLDEDVEIPASGEIAVACGLPVDIF